MEKLLNEETSAKIPKIGEMVTGEVTIITKNGIYVDLPGLTGGFIRGKETETMFDNIDDIKVGDMIESVLLDVENEKGLLELSLRSANEQQMWAKLNNLKETQETVEVKVKDANKGGLMIKYGNIEGFMPVSQLHKDHYPRVEGANKAKILVKLKKIVNQKIKAQIIDLNEKENKIIFSEKEVYFEDQKEKLDKYKERDVVKCRVSGIVDFGVFVEFEDGLEGLIHISELAWQRIESPANLFKIGDELKAQIIGIDKSRITLSAKSLIDDPWKKTVEKYKVGQSVEGKVVKVDEMGAFVELDKDISGLAHLSELSNEKINTAEDVVKVGEKYKFKILSIEPDEHRLGLSLKK
jgi:small subunit ribosomal protein S1